MFLRVLSTAASIGALYSTYLGFTLLFEAVQGHSSHAGTILKVGFGAMLLLLSVMMFTASVIGWKSSASSKRIDRETK